MMNAAASRAERRASQESHRLQKFISKPTNECSAGHHSNQPYLLGAVIGDIVGSRFERRPHKNPRDFELIPLHDRRCRFTDDTVLTIAVAYALINGKPYHESIRYWANLYPNAGYGKTFRTWMVDETMGPYNSWGNGSAMRVSPCGYLSTLERVLEESKASAECTHNHPEGIKGAQATAACIYLARNGKSKQAIKDFVCGQFGYNLDRGIEVIRPTYQFDVSCQGSVPESIIAFLEGNNYEETIRFAVSLGGDSDTQAAIAGSIAQAFYREDISFELESRARQKLVHAQDLMEVVDSFNQFVTAQNY